MTTATTKIQNSEQVSSPYLPSPAKLLEVKQFTEREKYFRIGWPAGSHCLAKAGQFFEVSICGIGEAPISIASAPGPCNEIEMCVRAVGNVTTAMHKLSVGDEIGLRGPFGNGFEMEKVAGKDLLLVAGGLGLAPCRGFILGALQQREKFGKVTILYGARSPKELLFVDDLKAWEKRDDCELLVTVDRGDESWTGRVGLITTLFRHIKIDAENTVAFIIGPPIMFKFTVLEALSAGIPEGRIYCSLERHMKCGLGLCGHCQIRHVYVCQDGPIFSYRQVKKLREGI